MQSMYFLVFFRQIFVIFLASNFLYPGVCLADDGSNNGSANVGTLVFIGIGMVLGLAAASAYQYFKSKPNYHGLPIDEVNLRNSVLPMDEVNLRNVELEPVLQSLREEVRRAVLNNSLPPQLSQIQLQRITEGQSLLQSPEFTLQNLSVPRYVEALAGTDGGSAFQPLDGALHQYLAKGFLQLQTNPDILQAIHEISQNSIGLSVATFMVMQHWDKVFRNSAHLNITQKNDYVQSFARFGFNSFPGCNIRSSKLHAMFQTLLETLGLSNQTITQCREVIEDQNTRIINLRINNAALQRLNLALIRTFMPEVFPQDPDIVVPQVPNVQNNPVALRASDSTIVSSVNSRDTNTSLTSYQSFVAEPEYIDVKINVCADNETVTLSLEPRIL
jgi:hypothetical protein